MTDWRDQFPKENRYYDKPEGIIYCGDCHNILPLFPKDSIDLVLTDPPYGINLNPNRKTRGRGNWCACRDFPPIFGDDLPFDPSFLWGFSNLVLWGANFYFDKLPEKGKWLIWDKTGGGRLVNDNADCEIAWLRGTKSITPRIFHYLWQGCMRQGDQQGKRVLHPTEKPIALMKWCLSFFPKAQLILDPFLGSGTTAVAAKELGRKFIGIEIEEKYCAIAVKRLAQGILI